MSWRSGSRTVRAVSALLLVGAVAAVWLAAEPGSARTSSARFLPPPGDWPAAASSVPQFTEYEVASYPSGVAHSPTLIVHPDGSLQAVWFAGSDEAAADVGLDSARFDGSGWSAPVRLLDAASERRERDVFVYTIGNPALFTSPSGATWLAYVTTIMGGWSTSRISLRRSDDFGRSWGSASFLKASPFFGISHLVRYPALPMEASLAGLPAYEGPVFASSVILVLDADGRVVDERRIGGAGNNGIQANLVSTAAGVVLAFLRPTG